MQDLVNFAKGSFDYATDACFYLRQELNLVTEYALLPPLIILLMVFS